MMIDHDKSPSNWKRYSPFCMCTLTLAGQACDNRLACLYLLQHPTGASGIVQRVWLPLGLIWIMFMARTEMLSQQSRHYQIIPCNECQQNGQYFSAVIWGSHPADYLRLVQGDRDRAFHHSTCVVCNGVSLALKSWDNMGTFITWREI